MAELFPLAAGLLVGVLVGRSFAGRTVWALIALAAVAIGFCATLISGEWLSSWEFVFVDIPEALVTALLGVALVRWVARSRRGVRADRGRHCGGDRQNPKERMKTYGRPRELPARGARVWGRPEP